MCSRLQVQVQTVPGYRTLWLTRGGAAARLPCRATALVPEQKMSTQMTPMTVEIPNSLLVEPWVAHQERKFEASLAVARPGHLLVVNSVSRS